jgi:hypothetical protein
MENLPPIVTVGGRGGNKMSLVSEEKTYELLRDKIKSKMDVTKFFSGFVSIIFGILMKDTITSSNTEFGDWLVAGVILTIFSVSLSIAALCCYDRLLMPPKFIKGTESQDSINKNLQIYMIRAWTGLFVPSIVVFILALGAFANARIKIDMPFPLWLGFLIAIIITLVLYVSLKSPSEFPD